MKVVFGDPKTGRAFQKEVEAARESQFYGLKIGDKFEGGLVGLPGYELELTGGSNKQGTPMLANLPGTRKSKLVLSKGVGAKRFSKKRVMRPGDRMVRSVAGNTVSAETIQLNAKILTPGSQDLASLGFVPKPKEKKAKEGEAAPAKEEAKPAAPKEEKKAEHAKKEEKPAHEKPKAQPSEEKSKN